MGRSSSSQKYIAEFQDGLFAQGKRYEELFRKLCEQGCESVALSGLLFAICTLAVASSRGRLPRLSFSASYVKRLAADLRSISAAVDRINKSPLNPKYDLLWAPPDPTRDLRRQFLARRYDSLPGLMLVYALHLERFFKFSRSQLKRMTITHFSTLQLLLYTEHRTGSARYECLSNLLTAGFLTAGGLENDIPKFFSVDALSKLKQRKGADVHFLERRASDARGRDRCVGRVARGTRSQGRSGQGGFVGLPAPGSR